jgi:hypothetical protein
MEYKAESELSFGAGVPHTLRYALVPHGPDEDTLLVREGWAFNRPLVPGAAGASPVGAMGWALEGDDSLIVSALRPSGNDVFVRVYECAGRPARGVLRVPRRFTVAAQADGLERPAAPFRPCAGALRLSLRPFEIRGFLLR